MNTVTRKELEVQILKKLDTNMTELIDTALFVAMYIFDNENNQWIKTNQEGVLFLYKKKGKFPYNMLLLNRERDDHFFQSITGNMKFCIKDRFIMYRNKNTIYALWFHQDQICNRITSLISQIVENINSDKSSSEGDTKVDVIAMLHETKQCCTEEVTQRIMTDNASVSSPSVQKFFKTAGNVCRPQLVFSSQDVSLIKTLKSDPKYNLESIEEQQKLFNNNSSYVPS